MTQENKELFLRDLCARLPYEVKAYIKHWGNLSRKYYEGTYVVKSIHPSLNTIYASSENNSVEVIFGYPDYIIKPYLFPLSSMTDKQKEEYCSLQEKVIYNSNGPVNSDVMEYVNWCYKNHIDINNLISIGLALDATELNIY